MASDKINEHLDSTNERDASTVEVAQQLIGDKKGVAINLTREVVAPERLESPARSHTFYDAQGFAKYLDKYGTEDTVVLGDPESGTISAVIDEKAEKGFEVVRYLPKVHPFWEPWQKLLDRGWNEPDEYDKRGLIKIKAFGKFLISQRQFILEPDAADLILTFSQIRHTKNVTMQSGFGTESINGVMIETKLEGGKSRDVPLQIPEQIKLDIPMFVNQPNLEIAIDLIIDASDNILVVDLRSGDAEAKKIQAYKDMLADVSMLLPNASVTLGQVSHTGWRYIMGKGEKY